MLPNPYRPGGQAEMRPRRFWLAVAGLGLIGLVLRLAILEEFLRENPIAEEPWSDSWVYWDWAGKMAQGQWVGDTPFLSAPLYPYFLGVVRSLGGGLRTVYTLQIGLHIATAVLIAAVARQRFGAVAGLLAAAVFLALTEPAVSSTRILADTLELLLITVLWWRWAALAEQGVHRWRNVVLTGCLIGILALTYPPAMLLAPVYAVWLWWSGGRRAAAVGRGLAGALCGFALISPATIHNAYVAGEFIPVSAHAGVTMRHGNGPDARGTLAHIPGVNPGRGKMHLDTARIFREAHGREGSWGEVGRYFRSQVLTYWRENPGATLRLLARKAYHFFAARKYSDIMPAYLEQEYGLAGRAILAPLATPWVLGAALAGLIGVLRRPIRFAPEWLLCGLPLLITLVFFYSPRYRLPAIPAVCGLAGLALARFGRLGYPRPLALGLCLLPLALEFVNHAVDYENMDDMRKQFLPLMSGRLVQLGDTRFKEGNLAAAEDRYEAALALRPDNASAHRRLGELHLRRGAHRAAIEELRQALSNYPIERGRLTPARAATEDLLGRALVATERYSEAAGAFRRAVELQPNDAEIRLRLAWLLATCPDDTVRDGAAAVQHAEAARQLIAQERADVFDTLAAAYAEVGRFDAAIAAAQAALQIARRGGPPQQVQEIEQRLNLYQQGHAYRITPDPARLGRP